MQLPIFYSSNLKYLRTKIGLSITELSEIVDVDPITLYELEKPEPKEYDPVASLELIKIGYYFTIRLHDILLTNLELIEIPDSYFEKLRKEYAGEIKIDRKPFSKEIFDYTPNDNTDLNEMEVARDMACQMELMVMMEKVYNNKRRKGTIGKINFFEPPEDY